MKLLALVLCLVPAAAEMRPLFNGRDLEGWVHEGPRATFSAVKGELVASGRGNHPNWLRTEAEYENFRLEFEYKPAQWTEAAVVLRAPARGRPMNAGIAIMLGHDFHQDRGPWSTGGIPGALPPRQGLPESWGEWRKATILLDGDRLTAAIDGVTVQDATLSQHPELRHRLKRGYIGFPDLGHPFALRNIRIEDLGFRRQMVDLFDGRSLGGWRLRGAGNWSVRDGSIYGANGHGILYAGPVFENFELTMLVRSRNRANGGVFLRGHPTGERGFEVQIYSPPDSVYPTGSIYNIERARVTDDFEDRWFLLQIVVDGPNCLVRLDGDTVAETGRLEILKPGRIGLQIHSDDASVEFRDIRVRPL
jgi:hypothetical protein